MDVDADLRFFVYREDADESTWVCARRPRHKEDVRWSCDICGARNHGWRPVCGYCGTNRLEAES